MFLAGYIINTSQMVRLTGIVPIAEPSERHHFLEQWTSHLPPEIQVILVHDRSFNETCGDNCPLRRYSGYIGVTTMCVPCVGPGGARNRALDSGLIKGEYVAFWDSDDLPILNNLRKELTREHCADLIIGRYQTEDLNTGKIRLVKEPLGLFSLTLGVGIWRMLFRKGFIDTIYFEHLFLGEDQLFFLDVLNRKPVILRTEAVLYRYVRHEQSLVTKARDNTTALSLVLDIRPRELSYIGNLLREKLELSTVRDGDLPILEKLNRLFLPRLERGFFRALALTSLALTKICQVSSNSKRDQ